VKFLSEKIDEFDSRNEFPVMSHRVAFNALHAVRHNTIMSFRLS